MRFMLLCIALLTLGAVHANQTTKVKIKLSNNDLQETAYGISSQDLTVFPQTGFSLKGTPNAENELHFEFQIVNPARVLCYAGKIKFDFYIEPADDLIIHLDLNSPKNIKFSGKGANNAQAYHELEKIQSSIFSSYDISSVAPDESVVLIERNFEEKEKFLKANKKKVSSSFYTISKINNYASRLSFILGLPNEIEVYQRSTKSAGLPKNYWKYGKEVKLDEKYLVSPVYVPLLYYYYPMYLQNLELEKEGKLDEKIARADAMPVRFKILSAKLKNKKLRKVALAYALEDLIRSSKAPASLESTVDDYLKSVGNDRQLSTVFKQIYAQYATISPGQTPPPFVVKSENGEKVSLSDFKGKVIYIDFWASWCGPCRHEMKNAAPSLHHEFKDNKDVVFLYISLDDDDQKWKNAIVEDQIKGIHVIGEEGRNSDVAKIFNIQGIPRYMIIDKEGKLFDNHAPRPSSKESRTRINEALKKG